MSREAQTLSMKEPRGDPKLESVHSGSGPTAMGRCDAVRIRCLGRPECADIVEKLEFLRRSQFRGPPEASTEYSLGVRLSDRSCHVRRSNRRCCGNYRRRQHYMRSSEIFAAPQFPSFSTVSTYCGRSRPRPWTSQLGGERTSTSAAVVTVRWRPRPRRTGRSSPHEGRS